MSSGVTIETLQHHLSFHFFGATNGQLQSFPSLSVLLIKLAFTAKAAHSSTSSPLVLVSGDRGLQAVEEDLEAAQTPIGGTESNRGEIDHCTMVLQEEALRRSTVVQVRLCKEVTYKVYFWISSTTFSIGDDDDAGT